MTGEQLQPPVQPERGYQPPEGLFNVDAMSDEQIVLMSRSFDAMARSLRDEPGNDDCVYDNMFEGLAADVRGLAARNPERVKGLVRATIRSNCPSDQELASYVVPGLIDHDYYFTREALIYLYCDTGDSQASEAAYAAICKLAKERLTPEQRADFNACLTFQGV